MRRIAVIALVLVAVAGSWRMASAVPEDLDPLKAAPDTHKLAFENAFVRVLEVKDRDRELEGIPKGKEVWNKFDFHRSVVNYRRCGFWGGENERWDSSQRPGRLSGSGRGEMSAAA